MQKDRTKIGIRIERTNTKIDKNKSKQINIKSKKNNKRQQKEIKKANGIDRLRTKLERKNRQNERNKEIYEDPKKEINIEIKKCRNTKEKRKIDDRKGDTQKYQQIKKDIERKKGRNKET